MTYAVRRMRRFVQPQFAVRGCWCVGRSWVEGKSPKFGWMEWGGGGGGGQRPFFLRYLVRDDN